MAYRDGSIWQGETKTGKTVWFVEIQLGSTPTGRPRMTRRQVATKAAAIKLRQELNAQKNQGKLTQRHNITVADYGRYWVREVKPNTVKPHTAADYEWLLTKYVNPYLGKRRMADLTFNTIQDWMNDLLAAGYGHSTVNSARSVLGQLAKQAQREQILIQNPVHLTAKVKKLLGDKTQVREPWTKEESQQVLKLARDSELDLFLHICLLLGLRHGEALGLTYSAIDLDKRTIQIKQTLKDERRITSDGQGIVRLRLQTPKTKSSIRPMSIPEPLYEAFKRHQMRQSLKRLTAGPKWRETDMVFTTSIGTAIPQANNLKTYKKWLNDNNLRYIRIHDLRHTFGTLALESGVPIDQVSQAMGHSDIGITKKIYAPNVRGHNEKAISALSNYLNPDLTVPTDWLQPAETITQTQPEITHPVPQSRRATRTQLTQKRSVN